MGVKHVLAARSTLKGRKKQAQFSLEDRPNFVFEINFEAPLFEAGEYLYYIQNWKTLLDSPGYSSLIDGWIGEQKKPEKLPVMLPALEAG